MLDALGAPKTQQSSNPASKQITVKFSKRSTASNARKQSTASAADEAKQNKHNTANSAQQGRHTTRTTARKARQAQQNPPRCVDCIGTCYNCWSLLGIWPAVPLGLNSNSKGQSCVHLSAATRGLFCFVSCLIRVCMYAAHIYIYRSNLV